MDIYEILTTIENCMDLEEGTLSADSDLTSFEEWDSLTILAFLATIDSKYKRNLSGSQIRKVKTASDILELINK